MMKVKKVKKGRYTTPLLTNMVASKRIPKLRKPSDKSPSDIAQEVLAMSAVLRSEFPNLDPNFFKSPRTLAQDKDAIEKPYQRNVWVYAASQAISTNLLQVPKGLDLKSTKKEIEFIEQHPILDVLDNPNPLMDSMAFWETVILSLLLPTRTTMGGQCFILAESGGTGPVNLKRGDIPKELWPFNDSNIDPIKTKAGMLTGWKLKVGATSIDYAPEEVIRIRLLNPYDIFRGQSPLIAALEGLRTDAKAQKVNETFFDNNASLGGTLETDGNIPKEEADRVKKEFNDLYAGPDNAGRTAILTFGLKYQKFMQSHQDMQFLEQRKFSRDEILAVYKVPKAEISIYEDMNYATALAADRAFWKKTLIPYDKRILKSINDQWVKFFENGKFVLRSDFSQIEALREDFTEKLKQAAELAKLNIPIEEVNRRLELNLDIDQYEWLKTVFVNFNMTTAEEILNGMPENDNPANDPEEDDDEKAYQKEIRDFQSNYWKNTVTPGIVSFRKKMAGFLLGQLRRNLKLVDIWENAAKPNSVPVAEDLILDSIEENELLRKKQLPEYHKAITREKDRMEVELDEEIVPISQLSIESEEKKIGWDEDAPGMADAVNGRLRSLDSINKLSFIKVLEKTKIVISESIEARFTTRQTAKALKEGIGDVYTQMAKFRVNTIARTEIGIIHSEARNSIMHAAGIKEIEWLDARDSLVRDGKGGKGFSHKPKAFKTTKVILGKPFNNGENIKFPRDPRASVGNIVNCRCTFRAVKPKG